MRHGAFDGGAQGFQVVGQVFGAQGGLAGHHAAANVNAHGGRNDGAPRGNDRTHGGANAHVYVGHGGDVFEHDGQARCVGQLAARAIVHGHAAGPHLQRYAAGNVFLNVMGFHDGFFI